MSNIRILLSITLYITYFSMSAMDQNSHPSFEEFKRAKSYLQSNFNSLPKDTLENYRPYLAKIVATKYKHKLLNHTYQKKTDRNKNTLSCNSLLGDEIPGKVLSHYDGTYSCVPDIKCDYTMWDELSINKILKADKKFTILLHSKKSNESEITLLTMHKQRKQRFCLMTKGNIHPLDIFDVLEHYTLNNDCTSLALGGVHTTGNLVSLFNISHTLQAEDLIRFNSKVTSLHAAHHSSLFVACSEDGEVKLLIPGSGALCLSEKNSTTKMNAQFSPNDKQLITWGDKILMLYDIDELLKNLKSQDGLPIIRKKIMPTSIRRASFSADGKTIIVAYENGQLFFFDNNLDYIYIKPFPTWRDTNQDITDDHMPLILWDTDEKLLFTLDSAEQQNENVHPLMIRKSSGTFKFLTACKPGPLSYRAMGLPKNGNSIIFLDRANQAYQLDLYKKEEIEKIDFIKNKANVDQLLELLQICKQFKTKQSDDGLRDENATPFINAIRSQIEDYIKENTTSQ